MQEECVKAHVRDAKRQEADVDMKIKAIQVFLLPFDLRAAMFSAPPW